MVVPRVTTPCRDVFGAESPLWGGAAGESISAWDVSRGARWCRTVEDAYDAAVYFGSYSTNILACHDVYTNAVCYAHCDSWQSADLYGSGLYQESLAKVYSTGVYHHLDSGCGVVPVGLGEPSARTVARQAVSDLSVKMSSRGDLSSEKGLALALKTVRDRHSLDQREYFYAFLTEVERRLNSQPFVSTVYPAFVSSTVVTCPADVVWRSVALSHSGSLVWKLAKFVGTSFSTTHHDFQSLAPRDFVRIWESVIVEVESDQAASWHSLWHLLHHRFLEVVGIRLGAKPIIRRRYRARKNSRQGLRACGFWTSTPPPRAVAAYRLTRYAGDNNASWIGGFDEPLRGSGSGTYLPNRLVSAAPQGARAAGFQGHPCARGCSRTSRRSDRRSYSLPRRWGSLRDSNRQEMAFHL